MLVLLAVHGIRSSLLQHHNSELSIILLSDFLIVQDSQPYITITTTKTSAFTILHVVVVAISLSFHILKLRQFNLPQLASVHSAANL